MCGICGIWDREGVGRESLSRMCDALRHRGPDAEGTFISPHGDFGLGHRRLSIIDLSDAGRQPLADESGDVRVVVNGEFYGFLPIREGLLGLGHVLSSHSDSEIAAHLYEDHGDAFVERLPGMFALALWDDRRRRLVLARDRMGKKPLYYAWDGARLAFASEIGSLLRLGWVDRTIDREALDQYFALGYVPGELCIHRGIRKLPAASMAVFEPETRSFTVRTYWELPERSTRTWGEDEAVERLRELLGKAVAERLVSDVPLGVFLSGGLDSSVVAATAAGRSSGPIRTFSIGFAERSHDELSHARLVAQHIGSQHEELVVHEDMLGIVEDLPRQYGEPFADSSAIPTYLVSKLTREHVTVALSGDGGDELFGGYNWYRWVLEGARLRERLGAAAAIAAAAGRALPAGVRGKHYLSRLALDPLGQYVERTGVFAVEERRALLRPEWQDAVSHRPESYVDTMRGRTLVDAMTRLDAGRYLVDDVLTKVDRASMAVALEVRCPLLDTGVAEFAFGLPDELRIHHGVRKYLLKRLARESLPPSFMYERKQGFSVPLRAWMARGLGDMLERRLDAAAEEVVDPRFVRTLLARHRAGRRDESYRLWAVLMFLLWAEGGRA